jgi:hypothetical protein
MARPTKLTGEVQERIVRALRAGNFPDVAARHAGVHPATYRRWMQRGDPAGEDPEDEPFRRFRAEVERALADAEMLYLGLVARAAQDGSASAGQWVLERRWRGRWGPGAQPEPQAAACEPEVTREEAQQDVRRLVADLVRRRDEADAAEPQ